MNDYGMTIQHCSDCTRLALQRARRWHESEQGGHSGLLNELGNISVNHCNRQDRLQLAYHRKGRTFAMLLFFPETEVAVEVGWSRIVLAVYRYSLFSDLQMMFHLHGRDRASAHVLAEETGE